MNINLVEYGVINFPEGMEDWRMFRIEYGGHAQTCLVEGVIWLPPGSDSQVFKAILEWYIETCLAEEKR